MTRSAMNTATDIALDAGAGPAPQGVEDLLAQLDARALARVALLALWLLARRVLHTLWLWHQRARQRAELARLDAHLLRDIGVHRRAAEQEGRKWFWQP
jgi:uncharacterized protein YjiS (DUF1127 family)